MKRLRIIVVGTLASNPYAGMAWMHMQIAAGLQRLGHDVYYFETTSAWPYDPLRQEIVGDSDYALPYLARITESFGLGDHWAYRRSYTDKEWFGLSRDKAEDLLAHADLVLNVAGATKLKEEGLKIGRLVYYGTDPVLDELAYANGDKNTRMFIQEHDDIITYGENIGRPDCPIPPLPGLRARTRQPVLLDLWQAGSPLRDAFTTVSNWKQEGHDIIYQGETYYWSKHYEFMKILDLPRRVDQPIELAMGLAYLEPETLNMLESHGWRLADAQAFSLDPWRYREYVQVSRGEFTVAKDQNVRLRSGWFSDRSACYLACGRPVITQDTGFGDVLPTGEGLFAFDALEEILTAIEAIERDYATHRDAARALAEGYFDAGVVLGSLLERAALG